MSLRASAGVVDGVRGNTFLARVLLRAKYSSPRFLVNIHRLRAIAILFIVAIHCTYFLDWRTHPRQQQFLNDFFDNSTILFVFISGFLFHHLSYKFRYRNYLHSKFVNVALPYLVAAFPAILYALITGDAVSRFSELHGHSYSFVAGWLLINGGAHLNYALWFMPVIFVYYLFAPVFLIFQQRPHLYWLLCLLIPFSLLAHRPVYEHGHNLALALYFLPIYLLGMLVSQYRIVVDEMLDKYLAMVVVAYAATLFGHFFWSDHHGKYTVEQLLSFSHGIFDWCFMQQILLVFTLYGFVKKLNRINLPWFDFIGEISFSMYFIHMYILYALKHLTRTHTVSGNFSTVLLLLMVTVIISCAIAVAVRMIFGKHSRSVLGS